jgi:RimK family alpha-L-glutamate ligase
MCTVNVVAHTASRTNARLGPVLSPAQAIVRLRPGETALGRLDVSRSLDGIERGLWALDVLEQRGVTVLNRSASLARAHDKLATAAALERAGVAHPRTFHVAPGRPLPPLRPPVVLKPRFGSWGRDVVCCRSLAELRCALERARGRVWFNATGGVLQEFVPPAGYDLRIVVAGGRVAGAVYRFAARGEWRTNVALGGRRVAADPCAESRRLALAAASAVGGDLVGVDLLPLEGGGFTVIEVNGAVDFTGDYSLGGGDVFAEVASALTPGIRPARLELAAAYAPVA